MLVHVLHEFTLIKKMFRWRQQVSVFVFAPSSFITQTKGLLRTQYERCDSLVCVRMEMKQSIAIHRFSFHFAKPYDSLDHGWFSKSTYTHFGCDIYLPLAVVRGCTFIRCMLAVHSCDMCSLISVTEHEV